MLPRAFVFALLSFVLAPRAFCAEPTLESRLSPLIKAHRGTVALAVKHLENGENYYVNAEEPMPTASLIKLAVMMEVYQQAIEEKVAMTDMLTLRDSEKVPGSGIL